MRILFVPLATAMPKTATLTAPAMTCPALVVGVVAGDLGAAGGVDGELAGVRRGRAELLLKERSRTGEFGCLREV